MNAFIEKNLLKMLMKHYALSIVILVKGNRGSNGIFMKKIFYTTDGTLHIGKHIWVVRYRVSGLTKAH